MTELAIVGGEPCVTEEMIPRAWPYWSEHASQQVSRLVTSPQSFRSWPSPTIDAVESWIAAEHHSTHSMYVNSGTSALLACYFGLGLRAGDEVLVPTNTFLATVTPLLQLNLVPVFCDSDAVTGSLDLADAARRIGSRTRAIVATHLWGIPVNLHELYAFGLQHDLRVVEDCSHAHTASSAGLKVGSGAAAAAFSLGAAKTVSGGVGGAMITSDIAVYERALLLGQPASRCKREVTLPEHAGLSATGLGANLRGNPLSAALALDHIGRLDEILASKNANLARLDSVVASSDHLVPPARPSHWSGGTRFAYKAAFRSDGHVRRDTFVAALRAEGVPATGSPGPLLHRRRVFRDPSAITQYHPGRAAGACRVDPEDYPVADAIQDSMVAFDITVVHGGAEQLIDSIGTALKKLDRGWHRLRRLEGGASCGTSS